MSTADAASTICRRHDPHPATVHEDLLRGARDVEVGALSSRLQVHRGEIAPKMTRAVSARRVSADSPRTRIGHCVGTCRLPGRNSSSSAPAAGSPLVATTPLWVRAWPSRCVGGCSHGTTPFVGPTVTTAVCARRQRSSSAVDVLQTVDRKLAGWNAGHARPSRSPNRAARPCTWSSGARSTWAATATGSSSPTPSCPAFTSASVLRPVACS
jgi:hypothetical protein